MASLLPSVSSPMASPSSTPRRHNKKERLKMISQITILDGTMDGKVIVSLKIEDCTYVDDSSLSLLSLPDGPFMSSEPIKPSFHSFVITVQNGQRIYGGSFVFGLKQIAKNHDTDEHKVVYMSRALVALTIRPLVDQLKKLLQWCVNEGGCNPRWLRCLTNIRLPQKGKCLIIHMPDIKSLSKDKCIDDDLKNLNLSHKNEILNPKMDANTVSIFRPFSIFPLFDYSLRLLFTEVLNIENFLLILTCALNEVQILILSNSYYNLMLISECLITLLNPFKWQHVYVPILPSKLGLHYLDAPTPFIMGINSRLKSFIKTNKVACFIDCDNKKVELNMSISLVVPPFIDDLRNELQELIDSDPRLASNTSKSEALKRVSDLAHKYNVISDNFTYLDDVKFNQAVRILFFKKMKKSILNKYQHFVACVSDRKEQVKFDAVSYLSEQPSQMRPFLQNFVETQMFASFIDETGKLFSKKQKPFFTDASLADSLYFEEDCDETDFSLYSNEVIESRFNTAQNINLTELEELPSHSNLYNVPMSPCKKRLQPNTPIKSQLRSIPPSPSRHVQSALTAQTNWKVVENLLKEVKVKTKRILLSKMGPDESEDVSNCTLPISNPEENTLISSLCDLIERIWSHGRSEDFETNTQWETNKCPFWSHLALFHESMPNDNGSNLNNMISSKQKEDNLEPSATWTSFRKRIDSLSLLSLEQNGFLSKVDSSSAKFVPNTLFYDFNSICNMTDIKTDIGKSRAFIRLSLERKLLSKHLRSLLYNQDILQSMYKRYAFLRCEEEREQFLTHLLTLNAVDLSSFTNTFTTSNLSYTIVLCSPSMFNGSMMITGSFTNTLEPVYFSSNQFNFIHKNFGIIQTLSLTVNSNAKVFIEQCYVRNNITNMLFKFECNKWLGKNVDDGSVERLLIAESVNGTINDHIKKSNHIRSSSIGRNWSRNSDNHIKEEKYSYEDLQTLLGESINQIKKFYFNNKNKTSAYYTTCQKSININVNKLSNSSTLGKIRFKSATAGPSMVSLFFGSKKFLWVMTQIFYYGFKNRRTFRKQNFIWDYILRVQCELKHLSVTNVPTFEKKNVNDFVELVDKITNNAANYGKDMKLHLFILVSLRDHKLAPAFLRIFCRPHLIQTHYDNESFFRDVTLFTFLTQILKTFNEIEVKLDSSLTKEI